MNIDTLPDEADFVFFAEPLPDDGLHRVSIAVEGMGAPIPTMMITVTPDSALDVCDRLNRRLGYDRSSWTAFASRCLPGSGPGAGAGD